VFGLLSSVVRLPYHQELNREAHRADRDWQRHAGRETDEFISEVLKTMERKPIKVVVNESGIHLFRKRGIAEFPDLDITVRGAISIGRRLQDSLAELQD